MESSGGILFHHQDPVARTAQACRCDQSADAAPDNQSIPASRPQPGGIGDPGEPAHQAGGLKDASMSKAASSGFLRSIVPIT